jgi:hypothetical protein
MSSKAMIEWDIRQNPLGSAAGDPSFGTPFGSKLPAARIFLRNHSARQKRRFVKVPVSFRRGAAEALAADAELRKIYNIATLEAAIERGVDKNVYGEKIERILFAPKFDGQQYFIPPAKGEEEPPLVQVPEGMWDLLMGNWDRMNSPDIRIKTEEMTRFANSQVWKHSPILFVTMDGRRTAKDNPFGFIEIERRTEKMEPIAPDAEFLTGLEMVES